MATKSTTFENSSLKVSFWYFEFWRETLKLFLDEKKETIFKKSSKIGIILEIIFEYIVLNCSSFCCLTHAFMPPTLISIDTLGLDLLTLPVKHHDYFRTLLCTPRGIIVSKTQVNSLYWSDETFCCTCKGFSSYFTTSKDFKMNLNLLSAKFIEFWDFFENSVYFVVRLLFGSRK